MQLAIALTASSVTSSETTEQIKWVTKGGSSINSQDGRFSLRKNSKNEWKLVDNGTVRKEGMTKEEGRAFAQTLIEAGSTDVKAILSAGEARVYSLRANGTMRRRHYLTGAALVAATKVRKLREDGKGLAFIADQLHSSVSYVRRMLVDLAITEELEAKEQDELAAMILGAAE
jgi:hypothetical protein